MDNSALRLAGYSIPELLSVYKQDLWDRFVPYLNDHIYDSTTGGFMCHTDRQGNNISTDKRTWYDGRGVWVYSSLYRHFGGNKEYLSKATQTVKFLLSMESEEYPFWPWGYTRSGKKLEGHKADIYGGLFIAEGLTGYAAASGENRYWQKARGIVLRSMAQYDRNTYEYTPHYQTSGELLQAPRVLGHWMIFLNLCGHLLDQQKDDDLKDISDRCIEALLEYHLHPEFNLMIEYLHHDLSRPDPPLDQFAYTGHGIEVLWMLMAEADRRKDEELFEKAYGLFKRHVEAAWDEVYGGILHELTHVNENRWLLDKVLWAQEEVLTGLMFLIERNQHLSLSDHSVDEWAIRWFDKIYPYVRETLILQDHPDQLWVNGGDRRMREHHQMDRFENYHHPRHLMMNIMALERMV